LDWKLVQISGGETVDQILPELRQGRSGGVVIVWTGALAQIAAPDIGVRGHQGRLLVRQALLLGQLRETALPVCAAGSQRAHRAGGGAAAAVLAGGRGLPLRQRQRSAGEDGPQKQEGAVRGQDKQPVAAHLAQPGQPGGLPLRQGGVVGGGQKGFHRVLAR